MIGAKPIEAGCKAMLLYSCSEVPFGSIVDVTREFPAGEIHKGRRTKHENMWLFEIGDREGASHEKYLMRIDDPEIQKQIESERELVVS